MRAELPPSSRYDAINPLTKQMRHSKMLSWALALMSSMPCRARSMEERPLAGLPAPHLQVVVNESGFACSRWAKQTFFLTPYAQAHHMPHTCRSLTKSPCSSPVRVAAFRCASDSTAALPASVVMNGTFLQPCRGSHEELTLAQVEEQHPNKSAVTQHAVDVINRLGIVIALSGAPGAGKSTISALGAHYGC